MLQSPPSKFKRPRKRPEPPGTRLVRLAEPIFGPLSAGEKALLEMTERRSAYHTGDAADAEGTTAVVSADRPVIRAAVVRWLCTSIEAAEHIPAAGVLVKDVRIDGTIDLRSASCKFPLLMDSCEVAGIILLAHAKFPYLRIGDTTVDALDATRLQLDGSLLLRGLRTKGPVSLQGAVIRSSLRLDKAHLRAPGDWALNLEGATIDGAITMRNGFRSDGGIRLYSTHVGRGIECNGTLVAGSCVAALLIESSRIGGTVLLRDGFRGLGQVRVHGSQIATLELRGARLAARGKAALMIYGSRIHGGLRLNRGEPKYRARCFGGIRIAHCVIEGSLTMLGALIRARRRPAADMADLKVEGRFKADHASIHGQTVLVRATIRNDVSMRNTRLINAGGVALRAHGIYCGASLLLAGGFVAVGTVDLVSAHIADELIAVGGRFERPDGLAITLQESTVEGVVNFSNATIAGAFDFGSATVGSAMHLSNAVFAGALDLSRSKIGGMLLMGGAKFDSSAFIFAESLRCQGSVLLADGFEAAGGASFYGAVIDGDFDAREAMYGDRSGEALVLARSRIGGHLLLQRTTFAGAVYLDYAALGGQVAFSGASITAPRLDVYRGVGLFALGCSIGGDLYLDDGFTSRGRLELDHARVGGGIHLSNCSVSHKGGIAISLRGATVHGDVDASCEGASGARFGTARVLGGIDATKATIEGNLDLTGVAILNRWGAALIAERLKVKGSIDLREDFRTNGSVDLRDATVGSYLDTESSWPRHGQLSLDGLVYSAISPADPSLRLRWLTRSRTARIGTSTATDSGPISAQPYEQLIQTLRKHGHERDARDIAVAKQDLIGRHNTSGRIRKLLHWLYGVTIHYGYRPQRALFFAPPFLLALCVIFYTGASSLMLPVRPPATGAAAASSSLPLGHPSFNPIAYSFEMFVPILNLQQKDAWRVNDKAICSEGPTDCGPWLRVYLWFHTAAGWVITTLAVAGFTGLIRRD